MAHTMERLGIHDSYFIDQDGRHVLLHGINMVCKDKKSGYIGKWDAKDLQKLQNWGLNVIRLGVIWDGLEPEPGSYNDLYIEKLRDFIKLAREHKLYIILDMHQDLYSSLYASGAPAWATITEGETYEHGTIWSDGYLFNGAVQKAFDHFWNNAPSPVGIGIRDHFIQAWGHLVKKLTHESNVIGYDIINEPFIGSATLQVNEAMFSTYVEEYSKRYGEVDIEELLVAWMDPKKKQQYLLLLEELEIFKRVVDASAPILHPFEQTVLSKLYRDVATVIRKHDKQGILFLETNYFANLGVSSMIEEVRDRNGDRDPLQAYAPHAYDLVTDTHLAHTANDKRLEFIFNRHEQTRKKIDMPMIIGEWGAFYETNKTAHVSVHIQRIMENLLCSDTYWHYSPEMDKVRSFLGVCRGYPMAVAGRLLQYRYEHILQSFHMKWDETSDIHSPTLIYLPNIKKINNKAITLEPIGSPYTIHSIGESDAGLIKIPPVKNGIRSLVIIAHSD